MAVETLEKAPLCSQCGQLSISDQKFCARCGAALQPAQQQPLTQPAAQTLPANGVPLTSVQTPGINQTVNVHVTQSPPVMPVIIDAGGGTNLFVRGLYFVFVGWWLGGIVSGIAWLLMLTVIGLPLGLWLVNRLPSVITLRSQEQRWRLDGVILRRGQVQHPMLLRTAWFLAIGWWLSAFWMAGAYLTLMTILLIPVSFWMYNRVGAVTTLYRS